MMYLGEAAKDIAPPLLLGAALLIFTSHCNLPPIWTFSTQNPLLVQPQCSCEQKQSHQTSYSSPPILDFSCCYSQSETSAIQLQLRVSCRGLSNTAALHITFSNHHVMQNSRRYTTPFSLFKLVCSTQNFTTSRFATARVMSNVRSSAQLCLAAAGT